MLIIFILDYLNGCWSLYYNCKFVNFVINWYLKLKIVKIFVFDIILMVLRVWKGFCVNDVWCENWVLEWNGLFKKDGLSYFW